jgi:hypothetical protein
MNLGKVKSSLTRRMAIPAIVAGALITAGAWTFARTAMAAAPAAGPMDESAVSPLPLARSGDGSPDCARAAGSGQRQRHRQGE